MSLCEDKAYEVIEFLRGEGIAELERKLVQADAIVHLAGVNRPQDPDEFIKVNAGFTETLCNAVRKTGKSLPVIFASSIQAERDNPYGSSKSKAESLFRNLAETSDCPVTVFRLPNVFGKWCRPEYNSVVATFCHHIAHGKPIDVHDRETRLNLVYIDDVVDAFTAALANPATGFQYLEVGVSYSITLGELADTLYRIRDSRTSLVTLPVGAGLLRALHATLLSYYEPEDFAYPLVAHKDARGMFVEFLKTADSGQFSFFTAGPGITRGAHYHHTKTEKFLVVQGEATFRFRHMDTGERRTLTVKAGSPTVVETIPGWAHDIANSGEGELVVLLWANEIFDRNKPDTIGASLDE